MGLSSALQIGRSAMAISQAAIQVAGNNMANAATAGYTRQVAEIVPARGERLQASGFVGRGVRLEGISRQVDEAVRARLRQALSDEHASIVDQDILSQVEAILGELSDSDLSSQLSHFFNAWSELANTPNDGTARSVAISEGETLAGFVRQLRSNLVDMRSQIEDFLRAETSHANELLDRIAELNEAIITAEQGKGPAGGLRDQRDIMVAELSQLMDITVVEQPAGNVDILVGSIPVVLGNDSRGVEVHVRTVDGEHEYSIRVASDGSKLNVRSGALGARLAQRDGLIQPTISDLDAFANALIYEVNRIHSQGQGTVGFSTVTATIPFTPEQAALPLNDPDLDLPFEIHNGSLQISLTNIDSGQRRTFVIPIDLDNVNASGTTGFEDDASLNDVIALIDAVEGVDASLNAEGRLEISSSGERDVVTFSNDSSGLLAAVGINTYFTGIDAENIGVNATITGDPARLAAGLTHVDGDNGAALEIALLQNQPISQLGDLSLRDKWLTTVSDVGVAASAANTRAQSAVLIRASIEAQDQAVSGVSLDEEAINLMNYERQFQAAARFINVIDEMMQTLLSIV
ncbi:MAG: flagellar hook-associated protein FlgK [Phycisphaerales bacterium]|nr:flagellar hook-associated protein FlgK [Phycisphaerales bacterium]